MNDNIDLTNISTKDLTEELSKREGVKKTIVSPHEELKTSIEGHAIVLVIID